MRKHRKYSRNMTEISIYSFSVQQQQEEEEISSLKEEKEESRRLLKQREEEVQTSKHPHQHRLSLLQTTL